MKIDNRLVSIQYPDKTVSRLKRPEADRLIESGKAKYISKSAYRSLTRIDKPSEEQSEPKPRQERKSRHDKKKHRQTHKNDSKNQKPES